MLAICSAVTWPAETRDWTRRWGLVLLLLSLIAVAPCPVLAAPEAAPAPSAPAATVAPAPPADELEALLRTLEDDKARAAFVAQLRALVAAQRASAKPAPETADPFSALSGRIRADAGEVLAGVAVILDAPHLFGWIAAQASDPATRARWIEVGLAFGIVFGFALIAEWAVRRGLRTILRRVPPARRDSRLARVLWPVFDLVVQSVPIVAFAAVSLFVLPLTLPPYSLGWYGLSVLVEATILARLILAVATALLVPSYAGGGAFPLGEETRNYLLIWVRRFTGWTIFGYAVADAGWWLGVPGGVYALILKLVDLVLAILAIVFVMQNRASVSAFITGKPAPESAVQPADGWRRWRARLGETWHILVILYIIGLYFVYALHIEGGSAFILRATVLSLVVAAAAQLLVRLVQRASERGFAIAPDLKARFPLLENRANRYLPILTGLFRIGVYTLAGLAVLQAWDVGSFAWFETGIGRRVTTALLSIAVVLAVALGVWEVLAVAIERHLAGLDATGAANRARRRTLLPLLRTAMLGVIFVVAALIILSQIGINIAPLLAGAGVVGLAVGFGSQALVKDIITGLFMLIEDQMAVGDIVDVGREHKGIVEAISLRTIRLRDLDGVVHTIPFSEVTTVKNLSKGYSFAVARITISYGEDLDRVVEILRGVSDELMADESVAPLILEPFDYKGVDRLDEFSVVLLLRVRTMPGRQLVVGRALNRLIKIAFAKHGIVSRDPSPVVVTGLAGGGQPAEEDGAKPAVATHRRRA